MNNATVVVLLGAALSLGCQNQTIDLESDDASSTASDEETTTGMTAGVPDPTTTDSADSTGSTETSSDSADTDVDPPTSQLGLLALETVAAPGLPLQGVVTFGPVEAGTIDLTLQWLSLDQGSSTTPREPIGEVVDFPGVPVSEAGDIMWTWGSVLVPAAANPLTGAAITLSNIEIVLTPLGMPYCGVLTGEVARPIMVDLTGSTAALSTIESVDRLPVRFPTGC
ncbi:MAG: hypothetical protein K0V04_23140 [Deltaproteobacteria bacterium]|nr:hypothetical protein [Deltaproteobacteria bacterium]